MKTKDTSWEIYWAKGWCYGFILGFGIDAILVFNKSCLSRYFGLNNEWWTVCKAGASPGNHYVNLGDAWIIVTFSLLTGCLGWLYWKISLTKNK